MADFEPTIVDRPNEGRYELHLGGDVIGLATYKIDNDVITIPHVETDPKHRGNGYAAILMDGILEDVRNRKLTVRPLCPFAAAHMDNDPALHDLVAS